jgi:hypothetical protein
MSGLGHVLKMFYADLGPFGDVALMLIALVAMWLGYRHSRPNYTRPSNRDLSIRRPPDD